MDEIRLQGMPFFAYHGILDEENRLGQRFIVSLRMRLPLQKAGRSDDVSDSVDYAKVYDTVKCVVEGHPRQLIEAVAEDIAGRVLTEYEHIQSVVVELEKPGAPIRGIFEEVSVVLERTRADL